VRACLQQGADPNYTISIAGAAPDAGEQPTTPLRLVMFRISDSDLTDDDLHRYAAIAQLLVQHGADPGPAMQIAESRYGPYDPSREGGGAFLAVWRIVAEAMGWVGEHPPTMYCHGCWEPLDFRAVRCGRCGLAFDRQNSGTYYRNQPTWTSAFFVPGHLIWPAILVLGFRVFGGPLPWPWWATFLGLLLFSGTSSFRVTDPNRERRMRRLGVLHRVFVVFLVALITFVTASS